MKTEIPGYIWQFILQWEGGPKITNDPMDTGGVTKYGISQQANPDLDIRSLTESQARSVYVDRYWNAAHCNELPGYMQLLVFNCAVNCGVTRSIKILQRAIGADPDGKYGADTRSKAIGTRAGPKQFAINYASWLMVHYMKIIITRPGQIKFARGWFSRTADAVYVTSSNQR